MTMPHTCRCEKCGAEGTITPGLFNVFAACPYCKQTPCAGYECCVKKIDTPPSGVERRAIVPTETSSAPHWHERGGAACYDKTCYDPDTRTVGMVPALGAPFTDLATCVHGYTRCMICKFPAP